jgi:maltooligosyltrehalose trehalohydrolase
MTRAQTTQHVSLGADHHPEGGWEFSVWAPDRKTLSLHLLGANDRLVPMKKDGCGYHRVVIRDVAPHSRYVYRFDDSSEYPDPASRYQPDGVHKPSEIVDLDAFHWNDAKWTPPHLEDSVFYELHVGTFSEGGTLDGAAAHLSELADLGVTTIELMPLAQFSGSRNWGYDGVYPFAVQNSYGGPRALQRFVDAAHAHRLAVALDVVYNHIGPEGNYLSQFGPYFTKKYTTPWGEAVNFDDSRSGPVRDFFIENALFWLDQFHIDVLRLDAVHGIYDFGARHILAELESRVELLGNQRGRAFHLVAESDLNDSRLLLPREKGGYGLSAQWSDDFHHSLHTLLTSEKGGYYADFGSVTHLANTLRDGWYYHGQYSVFRRRRHGNSPSGISSSHFVVCIQNHDQVGNRARGERLSALVGLESQKLAAGVTLLSSFVPLLFMGEEYGERSPFQYFVSHGDEDLIEAVRRGRKAEFAHFGWQDEVPDPQDETTFANSKLHLQLRDKEPHRTLLLFYRELIRLRRKYNLGSEADWQITEDDNLNVITAVRSSPDSCVAMIFNFSPGEITLPPAPRSGQWITELYSADSRWLGPGNLFPATVDSDATIALPSRSFAVLRHLDLASEINSSAASDFALKKEQS